MQSNIFYKICKKNQTTIEVMAVWLCVILVRNERNRTWAYHSRENFVAEITQMITPEQIATPQG